MASIPYPLSADAVLGRGHPLSLDAATFRFLFGTLGPSLGMWRAAEVAVLRGVRWAHPVLDLGCGDGLVTSLIAHHVDIGVDPWPDAIRCAAERGTYESLEQATIERCSLPDGCVQTIVSNSVLEHIPAVEPVLASAARLLRPGGRLVFTVPTPAFARWLLLPSTRYGAWRNAAYDHVNVWTADEWARRLEAAGFTVEETRRYLRRPLVALWDALELAQRVWIGRRRVFGELWKRIPDPAIALLARAASRLDLSSPPPGGGQMIVARKEG